MCMFLNKTAACVNIVCDLFQEIAKFCLLFKTINDMHLAVH